MLGLARLSYALAAGASFPPAFARLDSRHATPWVGLVFQAVLAMGASLVLDIPTVLGTAVFFLGLCYVLTALAALTLVTRVPEQALHLPGLRAIFVLAAAYLAAQASATLMLLGASALAAGFFVYLWRRGTWRAARDRAAASGA
jgi:amino acid transporter